MSEKIFIGEDGKLEVVSGTKNTGNLERKNYFKKRKQS